MSDLKGKKSEEKLSQVIRVNPDLSLDIDAEVIRLSRIARRTYYRWEVVELMWDAYQKSLKPATVIDEATIGITDVNGIGNKDARLATSAHTNLAGKEANPGISSMGGGDVSAATGVAKQIADLFTERIAGIEKKLKSVRRELERINHRGKSKMAFRNPKRAERNRQPAKPGKVAQKDTPHTEVVLGGGGVNPLHSPNPWNRQELED